MEVSAAAQEILKGVRLMKNASVRIQRSRTVYFDPYMIEGCENDADFIFISHCHYDHFSPDDIRKISRDDTVLIAPESCIRQMAGEGFDNVFAVRPSESYEVGGLSFGTVPMYNIGKQFHPKQNNWVGYIVRLDGISYYFAGDTDIIPEMKDIDADAAFLPAGGTYTMTASQAAKAAAIIRPKVAVPIHYADVAGTVEDGAVFLKELDGSVEGVLLK